MQLSSGDPLKTIVALALVVSVPFAVFLWHASAYGPWLIDDAGISFAYAKNLISGEGLVAQAGADPVEGFSNPLWTIVIALLYGLDLFFVPITPKILSALFIFLGFLAIAAGVRQVVSGRAWMVTAGMALILCAANPGFVIWSVSGLENPLLVFLVSLLLLILVRMGRDSPLVGNGSSLAAGLVAAALALTRPDGILYSVVFPIALLSVRPIAQVRASVRQLLLYGVTVLLPVSAYVAFRLSYFGEWLPNTYYAKPGTSLSGLLDLAALAGPGATRFSELTTAVLPFFPLALPLLLGLSVSGATYMKDRVVARSLGLVSLVLFVALLPHLLLPSDWMGEFRFATPVFLISYLLCFLVMELVLANVGTTAVKWTLMVSMSLAVLLLSFHDFRFRASNFAGNPAAPLAGVAKAHWHFGELADRFAIQNATMLVPDLGGSLMYSKLRVIDLAGLCDREFGRLYFRGALPAEFADHIASGIKPSFVHIHGYWARASGLTESEAFARDYLSLGNGDFIRRAALPENIADTLVQEAYDAKRRTAPEATDLTAYPRLGLLGSGK